MLIIKRGKLDKALLAKAYTEEKHFAHATKYSSQGLGFFFLVSQSVCQALGL